MIYIISGNIHQRCVTVPVSTSTKYRCKIEKLKRMCVNVGKRAFFCHVCVGACLLLSFPAHSFLEFLFHPGWISCRVHVAPLFWQTFAKIWVCSHFYDFRLNLIRDLVQNFISWFNFHSPPQVRKMWFFYPYFLQSFLNQFLFRLILFNYSVMDSFFNPYAHLGTLSGYFHFPFCHLLDKFGEHFSPLDAVITYLIVLS